MSWFSDRIGKFGRSGGTALLQRETGAERAQVASGPALIMLVADAHGVASYRLHAYHDTAPAKAFLEYWFPRSSDTGVISFWALTYEPDTSDIEAEPMVLVRDAAKPGVIYPFSFVDMDSAQAFARQEVEKGLGLDSVLIYWAATVRMERDAWGTLQVSPDSPPARARHRMPLPIIASPEPAAEPMPPSVEAAPTITSERPAIFATPRASMAFMSPAKKAPVKKPNVLEEKLELDKAIPEEFGGSVITNGPVPRKEQTAPEQRADDLQKELLKVLEIKRWEMREGPFRGIDSPPGRF